MNRYFLSALGAAMLAFAGGSAFAADMPDNGDMANNDVYSAMDSNRDKQISKDEFDTYYADNDIFDAWDADDDGWIDDGEFGDGLFDLYDDDNDDLIDDAEWENGLMVDDYGENGFWDM